MVRQRKAKGQSVATRALLGKVEHLDRIMPMLKHYCAGCWAWDGQLIDRDDHTCPSGCRTSQGDILPTETMGKHWRSFWIDQVKLVANFRYCWHCRMPQDRQFRPACHAGYDPGRGDERTCPFKDMIPMTLTLIRHNTVLWEKAREEFGLEEGLRMEEFGHWLHQEEGDSRWNNTIEMFLWFAREVRGLA
jgi:hypothetical protein